MSSFLACVQCASKQFSRTREKRGEVDGFTLLIVDTSRFIYFEAFSQQMSQKLASPDWTPKATPSCKEGETD